MHHSCKLLFITAGLSASGAWAQTGRFQVAGPEILSPAGQRFEVNGANIGLWVDATRPQYVDCLKNRWGMNTVRVFLKLDNATAESRPTDELLDRYVNAFTTDANGAKTVVIFEFHDKSGGYYRNGPNEKPTLDELRANWKRIASRYKNNPYVWFNVMNEPGYNTPALPEWLALHKQLVQDIRSTGATNVVVCDGSNFASEENNSKANLVPEADSAILTHGPELLESDPVHNVVFSLHTYTGWNYGEAKLDDFVERVQKKKLALIIGEYAATTGNSLGDLDTTEAAQAVFRVSRARHIGKLVWHFFNGDGNSLATNIWGGTDGININGSKGERPTNLSWLGEQLWDDLHRNAALPLRGLADLPRFAWSASSSVQGSNASDCIDADVSSAWSVTYIQGAQDAPAPQKADWIQIDLGSPQMFSAIALDTRKSASAFPRDFKIYTSNDGATFGDPVATVENNEMGVARASFPLQKARFVRVSATRFGKDWKQERTGEATYVSWTVADLNLYGPGQTAIGAEAKNELSRAGWVAKANKRSGWSKEWEGGALDGDVHSRWTGGSEMKEGDEFLVDMQRPQTFRALELNSGFWGNGYTRKWQLFVSSDGQKWGEALAQGLGQPVTRIFLPVPVTARYFKVVSRADVKGEWWSLGELRVYN